MYRLFPDSETTLMWVDRCPAQHRQEVSTRHRGLHDVCCGQKDYHLDDHSWNKFCCCYPHRLSTACCDDEIERLKGANNPQILDLLIKPVSLGLILRKICLSRHEQAVRFTTSAFVVSNRSHSISHGGSPIPRTSLGLKFSSQNSPTLSP